MPLLDHFHPPLSQLRHWESFHARWTNALADSLNDHLLPEGFFAEVQVHVGPRVEADVGTFAGNGNSSGAAPATGGQTALAVSTPPWTVPQPSMRFPAEFLDDFEVQVISTVEGGPVLVAAIELISPRNKDRPEARRVFAAKCASYLSEGVGLTVIDIVTSRQANLHNELIQLLDLGSEYLLPAGTELYAVAYRPAVRLGRYEVDAWTWSLSLSNSLPVVPLALRNADELPVDLEVTYAEACRHSRMP